MFWHLEEARLVQERTATSAADALTLSLLPAVPAGKVHCVIAAGYIPDAAETQDVSFYKVTSTGAPLTLFNPKSMTLNPARATFIEQGMEVFLLPGEYLLVRRGDHTAGSAMSVTMQFVEIDLPLYTYDEPQIVKRQIKAVSSFRTQLGGGAGGLGSRGDRGAGRDRGGGGTGKAY